MIRYVLVFSVYLWSISVAASSIKSELGYIPKSPNDQRDYYTLTLDNQLQVVLISDPTSDKASAALDVYVGSADDPSEFLGLAHFLEHMLFLGTKKYPTPDEYQKFISNHGGSHNAFTSLDHTNYFFDINANHLEEALDRFSEQFTSPLFNEAYVEREVNAVHSEYTAKVKDDSRRFFSALKTTLAKDHPYSKFSVGNLDTLTDRPNKTLREALLEFYDAHYSANNMRLVVLGKEPIETLKSWVVNKFQNIPNKNLEHKNVTQDFFAPDALPLQLNIQSVMDKRSLTLAFPIPSGANYPESKPLNYIANLVGHEGKGSLLSKLKSMDLVDSLSAGAQFDSHEKSMFMISMSLTQKGLSNYQDILNIVFDYLALLKKEGIKKRYFDEQATLLDIAFKFQEKTEAIHLTSALAMALHENPASDVLVKDYQLTDFNPELYLTFIDKLKPTNMLMILHAQDVDVDQESDWYNAPYKATKLKAELISELEATLSHDDLHLPKPNIFIPENTVLLGNTNSEPELLKKSEGFEAWYALDASFGTPKANIYLTLRSPVANNSPENANKTDLLISLINDSLTEFSYPAYLAGLQFELYKHLRGATIKISGYNDKQSNLLIKILNTLKFAHLNPDRFDIIKERLRRELDNAKDKKPFEQAISQTQNLLINPSWNEQEKLAALTHIEFNAMPSFRDEFLSQLEAVLFVNGNVSRASTLNMANQIAKIVLKPAQKVKVPRANITKLVGDQVWSSALEVDHSDTGFVYYLQGKVKSHSEQAKFRVLNQILSTEFYGSIRTDKQLGYIVFSTNFDLLDLPAIAFIIQSPSAKADVLYEENIEFLISQRENMSTLSDAELNRYKQAVISRLLKQENTLYSRSNKYWQDIDRENFSFNTKQSLADEVEKVQQKDLIELMERLIAEKGKSLLVYTQSQGGDKLDEPSFSLRHLSKEQKSSLPLH
ncbi:MAG: insulinase family protein [Oleiphilus sp.]